MFTFDILSFSDIPLGYDIGLRLKDFVLSIYDSQQTPIHVHVQSSPVQTIYNIAVRNLNQITKIRIDRLNVQLDNDQTPVLSICEVEVFGGNHLL